MLAREPSNSIRICPFILSRPKEKSERKSFHYQYVNVLVLIANLEMINEFDTLKKLERTPAISVMFQLSDRQCHNKS